MNEAIEREVGREQDRARECMDAGCIWYKHATGLSADLTRFGDEIDALRSRLTLAESALTGGMEEVQRLEAQLAAAEQRLREAEQARDLYAAEAQEANQRAARLEAAVQAWKEYAEHQEWCRNCAEGPAEDCSIGGPLRDAARAALAPAPTGGKAP